MVVMKILLAESYFPFCGKVKQNYWNLQTIYGYFWCLWIKISSYVLSWHSIVLPLPMSFMICWLASIPLPVYSDFIHGIEQPKRIIWAETRYWYMSSMANGREWMQECVRKRNCKSLIFVETSRYQVQKDPLKDYHKEKATPMEARYNKVYPALGKPFKSVYRGQVACLTETGILSCLDSLPVLLR